MISGITSEAVLDIFLSRDLDFPTTVGWANGHKNAYSVGAAEKETLIPKEIKIQ
jgi:hypothetical protein